jgi:hypothetical protein
VKQKQEYLLIFIGVDKSDFYFSSADKPNKYGSMSIAQAWNI